MIELKLLVHKYAPSTKAVSHPRWKKPARIQDCTENIIIQNYKCTFHSVHRNREVDSTRLRIRLKNLIKLPIYLSLNTHIDLTKKTYSGDTIWRYLMNPATLWGLMRWINLVSSYVSSQSLLIRYCFSFLFKTLSGLVYQITIPEGVRWKETDFYLPV